MIKLPFPKIPRGLPVWAVIAVIMLVSVIIRIRALGIPLDRDEGGYAYIAQLLSRGELPYSGAYDIRFPGIYFVYALIMAFFGQSGSAAHLGLLTANAAAVILIFFLAKYLFNSWTGVAACASYAVLTLNPTGDGFSANVEHFMMPPVIGGIYLLLKALDRNRPVLFFISGIILGLAVLLKQHALIFCLFCAGYILSIRLQENPFPWRKYALNTGLFFAGSVLPFCLLCAFFALTGVFDKFLFWTLAYSARYVSAVSLVSGIRNFTGTLSYMMRPNFLLWFAGLLGLVAFVWDKEASKRFTFVIMLLIASFTAICPGLYFRSHYFIFFLPVLSILIGISLGAVYRLFLSINRYQLQKIVPAVLALILFCEPLIAEKKFYFKMSPGRMSRRIYSGNPFPEALNVANYIKQQTSENDNIAVVGSEPQIYFYSGRRSATKYIYAYLLMHLQKYSLKMQREMAAEIELNKPKYIVVINASTSWLMKPDSEKFIIGWTRSYIEKNYELSGIVDVLSDETDESTVYKWGRTAWDYIPKSNCNIFVFKKRDLVSG